MWLCRREPCEAGKNGGPAEQTLPGALGSPVGARGPSPKGFRYFYRLLVYPKNYYLCKSYSVKYSQVPDEARTGQDNLATIRTPSADLGHVYYASHRIA